VCSLRYVCVKVVGLFVFYVDTNFILECEGS
jgi:hypothetical protein